MDQDTVKPCRKSPMAMFTVTMWMAGFMSLFWAVPRLLESTILGNDSSFVLAFNSVTKLDEIPRKDHLMMFNAAMNVENTLRGKTLGASMLVVALAVLMLTARDCSASGRSARQLIPVSISVAVLVGLCVASMALTGRAATFTAQYWNAVVDTDVRAALAAIASMRGIRTFEFAATLLQPLACFGVASWARRRVEGSQCTQSQPS